MGRWATAREAQGQQSHGVFRGRDDSGHCEDRVRVWALTLASRPGPPGWGAGPGRPGREGPLWSFRSREGRRQGTAGSRRRSRGARALPRAEPRPRRRSWDVRGSTGPSSATAPLSPPGPRKDRWVLLTAGPLAGPSCWARGQRTEGWVRGAVELPPGRCVPQRGACSPRVCPSR